MLFSVSDPPWPALPSSLLFLSFPLFFTPHSPQWGSPLHAEQQVGLLLSFCPASSPEPRLACLHSSALIWRSQGPLPPPPSLLCGVQTLSPPLQRKKAAPTFLELSLDLTPTIICRSKAMSALACLRCLPSGSGFVSAGIDPRAYLAVVAKVRVLFFYLETDVWSLERGEAELVTGVCTSNRPTSVLKAACTLPKRNVTRGICRERGGKTPGGADPLRGLSRGNSRPDARFN